MLKKITKSQQRIIDKLLSTMTLKEKASQILCWNINKEKPEEIKAIVKKYPIGSVFIGNCSKKRLKEILQAIKDIKIPIVVAGDLEHGAGSVIEGTLDFPLPMAASAANDTELIKKMGEAASIEGRQYGFHWTFAPVVDLSLNYNNPVTGNRALGDRPNNIIKMVKPYLDGIQENGRMAACCKHFPGDGVDDRDQHLCTSVNSLSKEEWKNTYGKVWSSVIKHGTMSIMVGHIALPFIDKDKDYLGHPPATISKKIQIDFLRKKLGFNGLIVSDAISMVGINSHVKPDEVAVKNILSGSDMVLFANPRNDSKNILSEIKSGKITEKRLNDAIKHVLELKARIGLLEGIKFKIPTKREIEDYKKIDQQIADKSVTLIRDAKKLLPLNLKKEDKVLTVTIGYISKGKSNRNNDLQIVDSELKKRGIKVTHLINPKHYKLIQDAKKYKTIFINIAILPHSRIGTLRMTGNTIMSFWRAFWISYNNVVFTSFGNPYHLYEMPSIPNYINLYSNTPSSQRAAVKFWLGEIKAVGKSPVKIPMKN